MKIYSMQKSHWSKKVDEDYTIFHLSINEKSFCGIEKRHRGIYNLGTQPMEDIVSQEVCICKLCFRKFLKTNADISRSVALGWIELLCGFLWRIQDGSF